MKHVPHIALVAVVMAGALTPSCTSAPRSEATSRSFQVEPVASRPRIEFLWQEQLVSREYLGQVEKEFARPTHVGATDELVVATSEGEVIKYQAASGEVRWRRWFDAVFHAGAAAGDGFVVVGDLEGHLVALQSATGEEVWTAKIESSVESPPSISGGRLFVSDASDTLYALDLATGELLWTHSRTTPEFFTVKGTCVPVVDRDVVYCGFSDGFLAAVQIDTGEEVWARDLSAGATEFVDVDEEVVVEGNRIFAASYAGGLYALDRESGEVLWRRNLDSIADFAVGEQAIFVASSVGRLISVFKDDAASNWSLRLSGTVPGSLFLFGDYVVATTTEGPLYVVDASSGYPFLKWTASSGFLARPSMGASRGYLLSNQGYLYTMKLAY